MKVSKYYVYVMTLRMAADQHKKDCDRPDCGVSLGTLKQMANEFSNKAPQIEQLDLVTKYLGNWPI